MSLNFKYLKFLKNHSEVNLLYFYLSILHVNVSRKMDSLFIISFHEVSVAISEAAANKQNYNV